MKLRNKTLTVFGFMFLAKLCFLFGVDLPQHGMNQISYVIQYIVYELFVCLVMYWMFEYLIFYRVRLVLKRMKDVQSDTASKINSDVHIVGNDEIAELAEMFNWMLKEFRTKHDDLTIFKKYYRSFAEDTPLFICRFTPGGKITFANDAFAKLIGIPKNNLIGSNAFSAFSQIGCDIKGLKKNLRNLSPAKPVSAYFHDAYDENNHSSSWVVWCSRAFYDNYGKLIEYQSIGMDLSQKKSFSEDIEVMAKHAPEYVYLTNNKPEHAKQEVLYNDMFSQECSLCNTAAQKIADI